MERSEFKKEYLINNSTIDRQHKGFFEIYNEFIDHIELNEITFEHTSRTFNELFMYSKYHFKEEEYIMINAYYPKTCEHTEEHHSFIEVLNNIKEKCKSLPDIINALEAFINMWINHITESDKEFGKYLENN